MAKTQTYDLNHPVALAVEPLRADAVERARQYAEKVADRVATRLAECDGDRELLAPHLSYERRRLMNKIDREAATNYRILVHSLTMVDQARYKSYRKDSDPDFAVMNPEAIQTFIIRAMESANAQYTAFICKLIKKIGACISATLEGSHVWGWSVLTVQKDADVVERWKTQQIVNVSKLGNVFNQWPSRQVKK